MKISLVAQTACLDVTPEARTQGKLKEFEDFEPDDDVGDIGLADGKEGFTLSKNLDVGAHNITVPVADPQAIFLFDLVAGHIEMSPLVGMVEKPRERFDEERACLKRESEADVVSIEKVRPVI